MRRNYRIHRYVPVMRIRSSVVGVCAAAALVAGTAGTAFAAPLVPSTGAVGPALLASRNLVTNPSVEPGNPAGCYGVNRSGDGVVFASGWLRDRVHVHSGDRALGIWWVKGNYGNASILTGLTSCSPTVTPGKRYTASVWTKSIAPSNHLALFRQTTSGRWLYWTDLRTFGPLARYSKVAGVTPPVPAGTARVAFGISTEATGIIVTDDYALVEGAQPVGALPPVARPPVVRPPAPAPVPLPVPPPAPQPAPEPYYANCAAVRAAGAAPLYIGEPGYRAGLDRDGDGIACEN